MSRLHTFFATCAPGLEPLLHDEARRLRLARIERQVGGVRFAGRLEDAWRANLYFRTAIRVLQRLARFEARDQDELYKGVQELDWMRWLRPHATLAVSAQSSDSQLDHSLFVAQRTKDAIVDQVRKTSGSRPDVDKEDPDLLVHVHLYRDRCTVSVDTSGESLHKRGWRRYQGRAPLAETLAAAVVLLSGWDRRSPLLDPFCGSATILIEAALLAADFAPGMFRRGFAFERFPDHDPQRWQALRAKTRDAARFPPRLILRGSDTSVRAIEGARENLAAAELDDRIEIEQCDVCAFDFRRGWNAWIVTNPPYGERVGNTGELIPLFADFGRIVSDHCSGYHLALLSGSRELTRALGIRADSAVRLMNGRLPCELLCARVP